MEHPDVLIIGGGLAGLACADALARWQIDFQLLEATERPGGRLRTDRCDGFQLDHGLHVLRPAGPVCQQLLDYPALQLQMFAPHPLLRRQQEFVPVTDDADLQQAWQRLGRGLPLPWLPLGDGPSAVPAAGIDAIARQLAARLPAGSLRTQCSVQRVMAAAVQTSDETECRCRHLVLATEAPATQRLLGGGLPPVTWQATTCFYFAAPQPPTDQPALLLAGDRSEGPISHLVVISNVAPGYAPPGQALVGVVVAGTETPGTEVLDPAALAAPARTQLTAWFGSAVRHWRLLRIYHLPYALPETELPTTAPDDATSVADAPRADAAALQPDHGSRPILCGDYCAAPSIEGALASGLRAAEAVRQRLG